MARLVYVFPEPPSPQTTLRACGGQTGAYPAGSKSGGRASAPMSWWLLLPPGRGTINGIMFDIQHDSPVPIHEQITSQLREHIASGALKPGARLPEYRDFAQELLANPQAVARAYSDL